MLVDPQTSGGLLIAVAADAAEAVLALAKRRGLGGARRVGRMVAGPAGIRLVGAL
jgi:selenide,water dikinase